LVNLELKYGGGAFSCNLPGARVLTAEVPAPPADPVEVVRKALENPIDSPSLEEIVHTGERVVVVTSDITRYTGSEHYLPLLVDRLNALGVPDEKVEILIGLGTHRAQTEAEHRKILGALYGRVRVTDHQCDNPAELVTVGTTSGGMTVKVNRRVTEADRVIVTGTVGFHYFAGFGGGRKGLVPGVASRETCMATHFAVFNPPDIGGKHPRARTGILEGNPVHEAILEAARMVRHDFLLNTVLSPEKKLLGVFCGDMEKAHLAACDLVNRLYSVRLDEPADLAVVSCGGYPKDINFIQSHKSLDYGVNAVREGGTLILLAACPDGFGHGSFFQWFRHQDLAEFEAALRQNYEIYGQTAHSTLTKARTYRVILVSELGEEETRRMGMEKAADLNQALAMAREKLPQNPRTVVIPNGGTVLPVVGRAGSD
jgi:nickel-dependent lactate racemase